uniref:Uncharacterized protein n=1 Tax=Plectus sambesii TaxID=2011161 RepID=A0A914WJK7_9BILA
MTTMDYEEKHSNEKPPSPPRPDLDAGVDRPSERAFARGRRSFRVPTLARAASVFRRTTGSTTPSPDPESTSPAGSPSSTGPRSRQGRALCGPRKKVAITGASTAAVALEFRRKRSHRFILS